MPKNRIPRETIFPEREEWTGVTPGRQLLVLSVIRADGADLEWTRDQKVGSLDSPVADWYHLGSYASVFQAEIFAVLRC